MADFVFDRGEAIDLGSHGDTSYVFAGGEPVPNTGESDLVFEDGVGLGGGVVAGRVYVFAGFQTSTSETYDPDADAWAYVADTPNGSNTTMATTIGDLIYVQSDSTIYEYDPAADSFGTSWGAPTGDGWVNAVTYDGKWWSGDNTEFGSFDPATGTSNTIGSPGGFSNGVGYGVVGDYIHKAGGGGNDHYRYDPSSGNWESLASLPDSQTQYCAACGVDGNFYVFGGETCDFTREYDPGSDSWTYRAAMPNGAWENKAVDGGGVARIVGDDEEESAGTYNWAYDPGSDAWTVLQPTQENRTNSGLAII